MRGHNKQEPPRTLEYAVEPRQSDIVIKVERIGDLLVDVLTSGGDLLVARLVGGERRSLFQSFIARREG